MYVKIFLKMGKNENDFFSASALKLSSFEAFFVCNNFFAIFFKILQFFFLFANEETG